MLSNLNEGLFIFGSIAGMVIHYAKKYHMDETSVAIHEWFGASNLPATIAAFGTLATAVIGVLSSGTISADASIWAVLYAGITTGIAVDSTTNADHTRLGSPTPAQPESEPVDQ